MSSRLKPKRGKKSIAENKNIILEKGEVFFEYPETGIGTGSGRIKMGDGETEYSQLPYFKDKEKYELATHDSEGLMSKEDKIKIDNSSIENGRIKFQYHTDDSASSEYVGVFYADSAEDITIKLPDINNKSKEDIGIRLNDESDYKIQIKKYNTDWLDFVDLLDANGRKSIELIADDKTFAVDYYAKSGSSNITISSGTDITTGNECLIISAGSTTTENNRILTLKLNLAKYVTGFNTDNPIPEDSGYLPGDLILKIVGRISKDTSIDIGTSYSVIGQTATMSETINVYPPTECGAFALNLKDILDSSHRYLSFKIPKSTKLYIESMSLVLSHNM